MNIQSPLDLRLPRPILYIESKKNLQHQHLNILKNFSEKSQRNVVKDERSYRRIISFQMCTLKRIIISFAIADIQKIYEHIIHAYYSAITEVISIKRSHYINYTKFQYFFPRHNSTQNNTRVYSNHSSENAPVSLQSGDR